MCAATQVYLKFPALETNMVTKHKANVSQEDIDLIREMYTMMGEVKGIVEGLQEQTAENTRTLRGHNGTEGLVTRFSRLESNITSVDQKIEDVKATLKDVPAAIDTWKRYPSLTWLVRHKFKETAIITAGAILLTVFIGFPDRYISDRLQLAVELLFAKWLGV
jgi:septation ring formation regulator EzrA